MLQFLSISIVFAGVFASSCLFAQSESTDTIRRLPSRSIEVHALRPANLPVLSTQEIKVKTTQGLNATTGSQLLSDAFAAISPSISIRQYGALGAIALASFRGLPAEYTIFYRDAIRLTNEQLGETDLGQLTLRGISRIELIPSANAVMLGGDAIGAAINLVSNVRDGKLFRFSGQTTSFANTSGFPEQSFSAQGATTIGSSASLVGGYSSDKSSGAFPFFQSASNSIVLRENSDALLHSAYLNGEWSLDTCTNIRAVSNFFQIERGVPGIASTPGRGAANVLARQGDRQLFAAIKGLRTMGATTVTFSSSYADQFETYHDPSFGIKDSATNRMIGLTLRADHPIATDLKAFAGIEYLNTRLHGTTNLASGDSIIARDRLGSYAALSYEPTPIINFAASVRTEFISKVPAIPLLPQLTLSITPLDWLGANIAYGRSFHAPTLNDLYWRGLGNTNLQSEKGESWQFGLNGNHSVRDLSLEAGVTAFQSSIDNQILWLPGKDGRDRPVNVAKVTSKGIEFRAATAYSITDNLRLRISEEYTLIDARNQTPGDPDFGNEILYTTPSASLLNLGVDRTEWGSLNVLVKYHGHKFGSPANSELSKLPPVTISDLTLASADIPIQNGIGIHILASVRNIGDVQYEEQIGYPMPGRSYNFSIELNYQ